MSRRSSSTPSNSDRLFSCGNRPSSSPVTNTVWNSRPLAAWTVISCSAGRPSAACVSPDSSAACARNAVSGSVAPSAAAAASPSDSGSPVAIGASTAIFGAVGLLAVLAFRQRLKRTGLRRWAPLASAVMLLALLGVEGDNVDVGAHIAGLVAGGMIGLVLASIRPTPSVRTDVIGGVAAAVVLFGAWAAAIVAGAACALFYDADNGLRAVFRLEAELEAADFRLDRLREERAELLLRAERLRSDPFEIETVARESLGMARPGEIVVRLPRTPAPADRTRD